MVALAKPVWVVDDGEAFLLAVAANVPEWQRDGLCAEYPGEWWFPEKGAARYALARAREVCRQCLVQAECLAFALDLEPELPGLWGGTDHKERQRLLRRGVTGALVAEHGVHAIQGREDELDFAPLLAELPPGMQDLPTMGDFL
jgi:hypothetical protein